MLTTSQQRFMGILHAHSSAQILYRRAFERLRKYIRIYHEQPHLIIYYFSIDWDFLSNKYPTKCETRISLFKYFYLYLSNELHR